MPQLPPEGLNSSVKIVAQSSYTPLFPMLTISQLFVGQQYWVFSRTQIPTKEIKSIFVTCGHLQRVN